MRNRDKIDDRIDAIFADVHEVEDKSEFVGKKIKDFRPMTMAELESHDWGFAHQEDTICIELEDGTKFFVSSDPEGNAPGFLIGTAANGKSLMITIEPEEEKV